MCGILGFVSPTAPSKAEAFRATLSSLSHRGPDAQNLVVLKDCILGHTRLSIVDIACGGQPMESANGASVVTFNGEIYGFEDVKKTLQYPFSTNSDTEVILALHDRYGENFVEHLPGMFAFALWNENKKTLICARDRFGEKPFYYALTESGDFIFASEIKALIKTKLIKPIISKNSIAHYLSHLYVHPHTTIYKNIHVLPPAHQLIFRNGKIEVKRYWKLPETNMSISAEEAVKEFRRLLDKSVQDQLVADVPVGAFLSGGLDSSTIVALASKYKKGLKTFSFEFSKGESELAYAREVSEQYQTDHTELKDENCDIAQLLEEMTEVYDEPFADSSNIPTYAMSKAARAHTKVILTGDGGDELCGGYYGWYQPLLWMKGGHFFLKTLIKVLRAVRFPYLYKFKTIERGLALQDFSSVIDAHVYQQSYFSKKELENLGLTSQQKKSFLSFNETHTVDDALRMDLEDYMPGDILTKIDRASMAHGLELRAPFLDVEFASFCISLPYRLKISKKEDKIILRKAFEDLWPDSIKRRSKKGFGAPVKEWLLTPEVKSLKERYLYNPQSRIFSLLPFDKTQEYAERNDYKTWILLVLALWLEKHNYPLA